QRPLDQAPAHQRNTKRPREMRLPGALNVWSPLPTFGDRVSPLKPGIPGTSLHDNTGEPRSCARLPCRPYRCSRLSRTQHHGERRTSTTAPGSPLADYGDPSDLLVWSGIDGNEVEAVRNPRSGSGPEIPCDLCERVSNETG